MTAPTRVTASTSNTGAVNMTTLLCSMTTIAASAQVGDKVVGFSACDGVSTQSVSSGAGWSFVDQITDGGTNVNLALFEFSVTVAATVADLTIAFGASQMAYVQFILIRPASGQTFATRILAKVAGGTTTNPNPPAVTNSSGASIDAIVLAAMAGDCGSLTTGATAGPSGYSNFSSPNFGNTQGAVVGTADKAVTIANAASEDPGVYTRASEEWGAITVAYYSTPTPSMPGFDPGAAFRGLICR